MKTILPVCDKTYRQYFIRLILKKLKECKHTHPDQLEFNQHDKQVIEYHLKDVARESVLVDTTIEECVGMFIERIKRLVKSEKSEWERVREIVKNNARHLTPEEIIEFDSFSHYFYRLNTTQKSEF